MEFPPGTSILLSSAGFRHGNCAIGKDEERVSYTQYMQGGLSCYVEYGCRLEGDLSDGEWEVVSKTNARRAKDGLQLFSTKASLATDIKRVFKL